MLDLFRQDDVVSIHHPLVLMHRWIVHRLEGEHVESAQWLSDFLESFQVLFSIVSYFFVISRSTGPGQVLTGM
jgi:hypothetical protein